MLDARTITDEAWRAGLRPEPQMTVSQWADAYRRLPSTSAEPGRWRTDRTPYLREIMDALSVASPIERVAIIKGAQTGGTEAGLNFLEPWPNLRVASHPPPFRRDRRWLLTTRSRPSARPTYR